MPQGAADDREMVDDAVRRVRAGNVAAYEVIVRRFERPLRQSLTSRPSLSDREQGLLTDVTHQVVGEDSRIENAPAWPDYRNMLIHTSGENSVWNAAASGDGCASDVQ